MYMYLHLPDLTIVTSKIKQAYTIQVVSLLGKISLSTAELLWFTEDYCMFLSAQEFGF